MRHYFDPAWIFRFFLLVTLFSFFCGRVSAQQPYPDSTTVQQKDLIDIFLKITHWDTLKAKREKRKILFSVIPLIGGAGTGGRGVVVSSINAAFFLGPASTTNISTVYFTPYTNFKSRLGFIISPNVWLNKNEWNLNGQSRISNNALNTYGLGGNTTKQDLDVIDYNYVQVYLNALRRFAGPIYLGMGYDLDYFYNVKENSPNMVVGKFAEYGIGTGRQTTATGITFNFLIDSRENSINPSGGIYSSFIYRINPGFLANDSKWYSIYFDTRRYISFSKQKHTVLGFWVLYWGCYGDVPYLDLPGNSLDLSGRTGRGYSLGRYRGKQMLYGETEYRFDISANGLWGAVVFANAQSYTNPETSRFKYILPAAGAGLRIKFNKRSKTNVDLDLGVGKNSFTVSLNLGEYF